MGMASSSDRWNNPIPPDPPEEQPCDDCELRAIDQDDYDMALCEEHHQEALAWDEADRAVKSAKEEAVA